jgi:hypothetical protein
MKITNTFTVTARCIKFKKLEHGMEKDLGEEKVDIDLTFDIDKAELFLFRFFADGLIINGYKLLFKTNDTRGVTGIILFKDDYIYIVSNTNQFINQISEGYKNLIVLDYNVKVMSVDFGAILDNIANNVEDEF